MVMKEKENKRRPTVTQVKEMEETIHRQCEELRAWRSKYHLLIKEKELLEAIIDHLRSRGFWARVINR